MTPHGESCTTALHPELWHKTQETPESGLSFLPGIHCEIGNGAGWGLRRPPHTHNRRLPSVQSATLQPCMDGRGASHIRRTFATEAWANPLSFLHSLAAQKSEDRPGNCTSRPRTPGGGKSAGRYLETG